MSPRVNGAGARRLGDTATGSGSCTSTARVGVGGSGSSSSSSIGSTSGSPRRPSSSAKPREGLSPTSDAAAGDSSGSRATRIVEGESLTAIGSRPPRTLLGAESDLRGVRAAGKTKSSSVSRCSSPLVDGHVGPARWVAQTDVQPSPAPRRGSSLNGPLI